MPDHGGRSDGNAFLLAAEVAFAVIAACCSSPQTAEINAKKRSATLMKWAWIGTGTTVLFLFIAARKDGRLSDSYWQGGLLSVVLLMSYYEYAKRCGLKSGQPGTED